MRTTLSLDDDIYETAKALADSTGKTLGNVISQLARKGMEAGSRFEPERDRGVPVFHVSDRARIIPGTRAAELMAEEGAD